ncbi:MAG: hypothetical protein B7Z55_07805, partial [Planctomycetales bacterium 12-60-4]
MFSLFYLQVCWKLLTRPVNSDVVVMTTPPFLNWIGALSKYIRGGRLISWEMDVYPEILFAEGVVDYSSWMGQSIRFLSRIARGYTDLTIALGPCMAGVLRSGGVRGRLEVLHNWADG